MKKILALLMAMAMLVSAAGCQSKGSGKEMSAEEVYKSAMEKTNALQDTDMTMNMDMNMAVGGEELTISSDIALKAAGLTTEEMQMNMSMGMELMGQAVDMNMYYKDGYFYTEDGRPEGKAGHGCGSCCGSGGRQHRHGRHRRGSDEGTQNGSQRQRRI